MSMQILQEAQNMHTEVDLVDVILNLVLEVISMPFKSKIPTASVPRFPLQYPQA